VYYLGAVVLGAVRHDQLSIHMTMIMIVREISWAQMTLAENDFTADLGFGGTYM